MSRRRVVKWISLVVILLLVGAVVTLYLLSIARPGDYRPLTLSAEQKARAIDQFEKRVSSFIADATKISSAEPGGTIDPDARMEMAVTQDELNEWVASLPDAAIAELRRIGLKDPSAAIGEGRLTFYAFWIRHERVLGVDLGFEFQDDGKMLVKLKGMRLGQMPVPVKIVNEFVHEMEGKVQDSLRQANQREDGETFAGVPAKEFRAAAVAVLDALRGTPIEPVVRKPWARVRIVDIKLAKELMTLVAAPLTSELGS